MYRNRRIRRLLFSFFLFFFFFDGLALQKRVVTSVDLALALALALAMKSQIWSFFFYLWICKFQFVFILFLFFFQYFCYFLIFNKKDGAMYLSFLLMTAKNHFTNRVTFCFYCFSSRTARHELKWESDRGAPVRTVASLGNTAGFTLQCPIYCSSSSSATVKKKIIIIIEFWGGFIDEVVWECQYYVKTVKCLCIRFVSPSFWCSCSPLLKPNWTPKENNNRHSLITKVHICHQVEAIKEKNTNAIGWNI